MVEVIGDRITTESPHQDLNRLLTNFHTWETLILDHFKGLRSKTTQPADGPSVFDVPDQYHRLMVSLSNHPNVGPRGPVIPSTMILASLQAASKLAYLSYRRLQKLRRKPKKLFQGICSHYVTGEPLAEAYVRTLITNRLIDNNQMTSDDYRLFWSKVPKSLNDPAAPSPAPFLKSLFWTMLQHIFARTLVLTKKGYLGLGPMKARKGDLVCILYGCSVPVIIRKYGQGHRFVGESYIHGLMHGAAVDQQSLRDTLEERDFILE